MKDNHHGTSMSGNISVPYQQRASTLAQGTKETRANFNIKETNIPSSIANKQSSSVDSIKPPTTDDSIKPPTTDGSIKPSAGVSRFKSSSSVDSFRPATNPGRIKQTTMVDNFKSPASGGGFKLSNRNDSLRPSGGCESAGYRRQYEQNLERDVISGKLSVADYHMRLARLGQSDLRGVDDGSTRVQGMFVKFKTKFKVAIG